MFTCPFGYPWNCRVLNKPVTSLTFASQQIARSLEAPGGLDLHPGYLPRSNPLAPKGLSDQVLPTAVGTCLVQVGVKQVSSDPQIHNYWPAVSKRRVHHG